MASEKLEQAQRLLAGMSDDKATGTMEIHMNQGGITQIYTRIKIL